MMNAWSNKSFKNSTNTNSEGYDLSIWNQATGAQSTDIRYWRRKNLKSSCKRRIFNMLMFYHLHVNDKSSLIMNIKYSNNYHMFYILYQTLTKYCPCGLKLTQLDDIDCKFMTPWFFFLVDNANKCVNRQIINNV